MKELEQCNEPVIDLGQASVETKGAGIYELDSSGDKLRFVTGIADG